MLKTTIVLFNGPPYSGKTTCSGMLTTMLRNRRFNVQRDSFAAPTKHFVSHTFAEPYANIAKDTPREDLLGSSVRQLLISMSEDWIKPRYGIDAFGRWAKSRIMRLSPHPDFVIFDDSGFVPEMLALAPYPVRLIRIIRPGVDFANDSRSYLPDPWRIVHNDGDEDNLSFIMRGITTELEEDHNKEDHNSVQT